MKIVASKNGIYLQETAFYIYKLKVNQKYRKMEKFSFGASRNL
jgi:hypothetical protein